MLLEVVRLLKEGGKGYFGSLYWLRTKENEHGIQFEYFEEVLNFFKEKGLIDYEIVDDPDDEEELNLEGYPKKSCLKLVKKKDFKGDPGVFLDEIFRS